MAKVSASWHGVVLAEADQDELIKIEGNWYFPMSAVKKERFRSSEMHTTCIWKGEASYYDIIIEGAVNAGAAWYYAAPKEGAIERVGKDFTNYVAFWRGVIVA